MAGSTPIFGFPYPDPSDLVANYPALGQQLAEDIENEILARGRILQVVQASTTTSATSTSATYADTNLSVSITPQYSTSKVLVFVNQQGLASTNSADMGIRIVRASTTVLTQIWTLGANTGLVASMTYLDSPATTSATTYKTEFARTGGTGSVIVQVGSLTSVITVMEVAA